MADCRHAQNFGDLERDLAHATEAVTASHDKRRRGARRAVGPGRPIAVKGAGQALRQLPQAGGQVVVARERRYKLSARNHREHDGLCRRDGVLGSGADRQDQLGSLGCRENSRH